MFTGVYAVGRPQVTQNSLWLAGVLAAGGGAVLAGQSAGAAWGFMKVTPGVFVLREGKARSDHKRILLDGKPVSIPLIIRRARNLSDRGVRLVRSIPALAPASVLLDIASSKSATRLKWAFIEADRLGLLTDADLGQCLKYGQGRPGAAALRSLALDRIEDLEKAKSILEGLMLEACQGEGIEAPLVNTVINGHQVDCVWPNRHVAVELDSYGFHRGQEMFERDLVRNNRMWSEGWVLLRYTWRRLTREPEKVVGEVRAALTKTAA